MLRRLIDLLAILLLLVLAGLTFLAFSFHPDQYRSQILQWVNQQSDWQVDYRSTDWQLTAPLVLRLNQVRVGKTDTASLLVDELELQLSASALLNKHLRIDTLEVRQPQLALRPRILTTSNIDSQPSTSELPWFEQVSIGKLLLSDADVHYQDGLDSFRLLKGELIVEDWQLYHQQSFAPENWRLKLLINAGQLHTPWVNLGAPQLALDWDGSTLQLNHLSADLYQGSIYAQANWRDKHLRIDDLVIDTLRFEYFDEQAPSPATADSPLPKLAWLEQLSLRRALIIDSSAMLSRAAGEGQAPHSLTLNQVNAELSQLHLPWPFAIEQLSGELNGQASEFSYNQYHFQQLTAQAKLAPELWQLGYLSAQAFEGEFDVSGEYTLADKSLHIRRFAANDIELAIEESWFNPQQEPTASTELPLNSLYLEQARVHKLKLLSYVDSFPFAAEGISLDLRDLSLIEDGQWQPMEQLWQPSSALFLEAPELAYRGLVVQRFNVDASSQAELGHLSVYAELPLGQLELSAQTRLDQPHRPWEAELQALLLDISPLARLADNRQFRLVGDLELSGRWQGQLQEFVANLEGELQLNSRLLQLPGGDLELGLDQVIDHPEQHFESPSALVEQGFALVWTEPQALPRGVTQLSELSLNANFREGKLHIPPQQLPGMRYQLQLAGEFDLAQHSRNLELQVQEQDCWQLTQRWRGTSDSPQTYLFHQDSPWAYALELASHVEPVNRPEACQAR